MPAADLSLLEKAVEMSQERLVHGLERVPDDRLDWSPAGDAKSPLALAGMAARFLGFFTYVLANKAFPERPTEPPAPPSSREEAAAALNAAFDGLRSGVAALTDDDLKSPVPSPWGEQISLAEMLWWLMSVLGYLQGQQNYVQTAYGDLEPNLPPSWYARGGQGSA